MSISRRREVLDAIGDSAVLPMRHPTGVQVVPSQESQP